jgi:hypothetical protein
MLAEVRANGARGTFVGIPTAIDPHPFARFIVVRSFDRGVRHIDIRVRPKFQLAGKRSTLARSQYCATDSPVVPKLLSGTPTEKNRELLEMQNMRDDGCIFSVRK